jgi:hypothetical protein
MECQLIALERLMEDIVPAKSLAMLRSLRDVCSNQAIGYALRRNQRRRAMRSFKVSEQFYERLTREAADSERHRVDWTQSRASNLDALTSRVAMAMADVSDGVCNRCSRYKSIAILAICCMDCGGLSGWCCYCLERNPNELPTPGYSCGGRVGKHDTVIDNHTSVTWMWGPPKMFAQYLRSRYSTAQAISVMKTWYAKDPIKPNLSFEEVLQQVELSQQQYQQTSWAILSRWLAKRSESGREPLEDSHQELSDQCDASVD